MIEVVPRCQTLATPLKTRPKVEDSELESQGVGVGSSCHGHNLLTEVREVVGQG